jgi:CBS domain-containing protein
MADDPVRALVHRPAVDVLPDTTLRRLAQLLDAESVGVAVVRAPHRSGTGLRAAGIVSERDVVRAIGEGADPEIARAEDVMTEDMAFATPDESIRSVSRRMLDDEIRHLPVVDDGDVIGVVSMRDLLEAQLDSDTTAR